MKLFISSDIEGTCGIAAWSETDANKADYGYFANQMTREVAAACSGAIAAGFDDILIKDAHDSARNLKLQMLPKSAKILRGWPKGPMSMMSGLDETFDATIFTGYHSAA